MILARIEWYLEFGHNNLLKEELQNAVQTCRINSDNFEHLERLISGVIPEVTTIVNIEFQTKRKYYKSMHTLFIQSLRTTIIPESKLYPLFQIIDNKKLFLNYLTSETVVFYKDNSLASDKLEVSDWWMRIQSCKVKALSSTTVTRDYARKLDIKRVEARTVNSLSAMSAYRHGESCESKQFSSDVSDFLCSLNDNDLNQYDVMYLNTQTGSLMQVGCADYTSKKHRQYRRIRSFLNPCSVDWRSEVLKSQIADDNLKFEGLLLTATCKDENGYCLCDSCYYCYKGELCCYPGECNDYEKYEKAGEF